MKSITLLFFLCVCPIVLLCGCSSRATDHIVDSLEHEYAQRIFEFQVCGDTAALGEAMAAVDQLLAMQPDNTKYKMHKAQYLLFGEQFEACRQMLDEADVTEVLNRFKMFPEFKKYALTKIDALEARERGDSVRYTGNIAGMEQMLRDVVFSDDFDLKYYCEHTDELSEDNIWRDTYFRSWLSLLYIQGGKAAVESAVDEISDSLRLDDQLSRYRSMTFQGELNWGIVP